MWLLCDLCLSFLFAGDILASFHSLPTSLQEGCYLIGGIKEGTEHAQYNFILSLEASLPAGSPHSLTMMWWAWGEAGYLGEYPLLCKHIWATFSNLVFINIKADIWCLYGSPTHPVVFVSKLVQGGGVWCLELLRVPIILCWLTGWFHFAIKHIREHRRNSFKRHILSGKLGNCLSFTFKIRVFSSIWFWKWIFITLGSLNI